MSRSVAMAAFFAYALHCGALAADPLQAVPPAEMLDAIFPVLRHKIARSEPLTITFARRNEPPDNPACGLATIELRERRGAADSRSFRLLGDPVSDSDSQPVVVLARLERMTVNADGSRRAYHPDDPFGQGICERSSTGQDAGICALDYLSNAEIHLFEGGQRIPQFRIVGDGEKRHKEPNAAFEEAWRSLWSQISARQKNWVDLVAIFGADAPDSSRLFYSKATNSAAIFDADIIPFKDGFPCQHDNDRREYFVAATKPHPAPPPGKDSDACSTARYLDSTAIPFFVLPGGVFHHLHIGDIAIGLATAGGAERLVFGIVGDIGPTDQIGEGSILFVRRLRGTAAEPMNAADTGKLDIKVDTSPGAIDSLAVLVLGGTAKDLGVDYSLQNIERVGRLALSKWSGDRPDRLQACSKTAAPNPLDGFESQSPN